MGLKDKINSLKDNIDDARIAVKQHNSKLRNGKQAKGAVIQKSFKIGIAIFAALCLISILVTIAVAKSERREKKPPPKPLFTVDDIAEEDIFLPNEPDFLPDVLLEKPQRKSWSEEDAKKFWTDPAEFGEENWRNKASEIIDNVLENVP